MPPELLWILPLIDTPKAKVKRETFYLVPGNIITFKIGDIARRLS